MLQFVQFVNRWTIFCELNKLFPFTLQYKFRFNHFLKFGFAKNSLRFIVYVFSLQIFDV